MIFNEGAGGYPYAIYTPRLILVVINVFSSSCRIYQARQQEVPTRLRMAFSYLRWGVLTALPLHPPFSWLGQKVFEGEEAQCGGLMGGECFSQFVSAFIMSFGLPGQICLKTMDLRVIPVQRSNIRPVICFYLCYLLGSLSETGKLSSSKCTASSWK